MTLTRKQVIFCDFDGTITESDNIISIFKHFNPPGWETLKDQILAQKISIRHGVGTMFSLLPTSLYSELVEFTLNQAQIRPGFADFIQFCKEQEIRLLITSGGIDFFVYPILAPFEIPEHHIYCNHSDFSGEQIQILWPHACDEECSVDCGMCKTSLIRSFNSEQYERIVIGDSITDLAGAKLADLTIARDFLLQKCRELGIHHRPFTTFYDVIDVLQGARLTK